MSGGIRSVQVPAALAFGSQGTTLKPAEADPAKRGVISPGTDLEYRLELLRVSIPP